MKVAALCPTFRHPELLANSLQMWHNQDYPPELRKLFILDDDPTFDTQGGSTWELHATRNPLESLSAKYNLLLDISRGWKPDAVVVWEDDDFYLPQHLSSHAKALSRGRFSKPNWVFSDYGWPEHQSLLWENAGGRFHSSMAFTLDLIEEVGEWPITSSPQFDQQLISDLTEKSGGAVSPWETPEECQFVYHWHSGAMHCQSVPQTDDWFALTRTAYPEVPFQGQLLPQTSQKTIDVLEAARTCSIRYS